MKSSPGSLIPLFKMKVQEKGRIKDIKEIIVRIDGLPSCLNGQILDMGDGVKGIIMGYDENDVLALVLGDPSKLRLGKEIVGISEPFKIPVGDGFIGRMVSAMGDPCDQREPIVAENHYAVFRDSPPIIARAPVDGYFATGTKIVDVTIPLAKGQRQLILGDRMTGKTVIAVDAILNQKGRDVVCIYCCVGKSMSSLEKVITILHDNGALDYTALVVATDNSPVGEQYLVPFSAASMGDHFVSKGRDVLVVFDDLTKHAWAYRQLSLLLDRPPGREAYPGDIFYVQTQLMERAGRFNESCGGGSMTFLAIAETLQGDLTGYIPSNLASMCDGQIFLNNTLFAEGFRPAIDLTMSLSIIGGRCQPPILKNLSRSIRTEYAHHMEIMKLSKMQSSLTGEAERIVKKGEAIMAVLQQGQYAPVSLAEEVLLLYALQKDLLTSLPGDEKKRFRHEIYPLAKEMDSAMLQEIEERGVMTVDVERRINNVLQAYFGGKK